MKKELNDIDILHKEILKNKELFLRKKKRTELHISDKYHLDLNEENDLKYTVAVRTQCSNHGELC